MLSVASVNRGQFTNLLYNELYVLGGKHKRCCKEGSWRQRRTLLLSSAAPRSSTLHGHQSLNRRRFCVLFDRILEWNRETVDVDGAQAQAAVYRGGPQIMIVVKLDIDRLPLRGREKKSRPSI